MTTPHAPGPLYRTFTALLHSDAKGGWTYVKLDDSADYFGTRRLLASTSRRPPGEAHSGSSRPRGQSGRTHGRR